MEPTPSSALKPLLPRPFRLYRADAFTQYHASLPAIPDTTRFVPGEVHPKIRTANKQTAIVTGPAGEEIYPDKYGRVKVQFFRDREDQRDENTRQKETYSVSYRYMRPIYFTPDNVEKMRGTPLAGKE